MVVKNSAMIIKKHTVQCKINYTTDNGSAISLRHWFSILLEEQSQLYIIKDSENLNTYASI